MIAVDSVNLGGQLLLGIWAGLGLFALYLTLEDQLEVWWKVVRRVVTAPARWFVPNFRGRHSNGLRSVRPRVTARHSVHTRPEDLPVYTIWGRRIPPVGYARGGVVPPQGTGDSVPGFLHPGYHLSGDDRLTPEQIEAIRREFQIKHGGPPDWLNRPGRQSGDC